MEELRRRTGWSRVSRSWGGSVCDFQATCRPHADGADRRRRVRRSYLRARPRERRAGAALRLNKPIPKRGAQIADVDHVLYYVKPTQIDDGIVNGDAFLARPRDEDGLSVNWLEWFDSPLECQVEGVRRVARITYAKSGQLARLKVGTVKRHLAEDDRSAVVLSFENDPLEAEGNFPADPSHALIKGVPVRGTPETALVGDLISECVIPCFFRPWCRERLREGSGSSLPQSGRVSRIGRSLAAARGDRISRG